MPTALAVIAAGPVLWPDRIERLNPLDWPPTAQKAAAAVAVLVAGTDWAGAADRHRG